MGGKKALAPPPAGGGGAKGAVDKWFLHFELMRVRQGHPLAGEEK